MAPIETVIEFMDRINQRDRDKLAELMTEDHLFIDSLGQAVRGRENMRTLARGRRKRLGAGMARLRR